VTPALEDQVEQVLLLQLLAMLLVLKPPGQHTRAQQQQLPLPAELLNQLLLQRFLLAACSFLHGDGCARG
jgi:hypothetical protein